MIKTRSMFFVGLVAAFVAFSALVASGATFVADDAASRYFKSIHGNAALDAAMVAITTTGDVTILFPFGIIITIIRRTRKAGMIFLIALVVLVVLVMYIKPAVGRPIPPYGFDPALDLPENFGIESDSFSPIAASCLYPSGEASGCSYPSGHASRATALAFIVGFALYNKSRIAGYLFWAFPVVIGVTRVYVMQHYPTDIIGGILFGVIVSAILSNAMKLEQPFFMSRFKGKKDDVQQDALR
jgi:undecaprenyl-diphosphatase